MRVQTLGAIALNVQHANATVTDLEADVQVVKSDAIDSLRVSLVGRSGIAGEQLADLLF